MADEAGRLRGRGARIDRLGADLDETEIEQEEAADDADPIALLLQEIADPGEAERGGQAVDGVGAGGAEAADEAGEAAVGERAADAEDADRTDRRRDGESDQRTLPQQLEFKHPLDP